jgi:hypothetical protein
MIKTRRMRWAGHVARMWENLNAYIILMENSEEQRPIGKSRHRWVDKIKKNLTKIG